MIYNEWFRDEFLSTPSARRATNARYYKSKEYIISIHALREEGDRQQYVILVDFWYFYPRPPRGGRLRTWVYCGFASGISIHALREEGDVLSRRICSAASAFLSTPSARRATCGSTGRAAVSGISIHALREEGDRVH